MVAPGFGITESIWPAAVRKGAAILCLSDDAEKLAALPTADDPLFRAIDADDFRTRVAQRPR
jgi:hypothetical protein